MRTNDGIYRDSLSAWKRLIEVGGLELEGRDKDLTQQLKNYLDPYAPNLEMALRSVPLDSLVQALFQTIQPFPLMFRDILRFFEKAGAREGQTQWKVVVGREIVELRRFEEFLERWHKIKCEFEVPAIDMASAFLPNDVRREMRGMDSRLPNQTNIGSVGTGFKDVDAWLAAYDTGRYRAFPRSLYPDSLCTGFDDAAYIAMAALDVIRENWLDRSQMLSEYRTRSHKCDRHDGLHRWSIAQNETDYWLRDTVLILANLLAAPELEQEKFCRRLDDHFKRLGRRRLNADIEVRDLERLLSLPVWRKRYELYGVWVATEIVGCLDGHDIFIYHTHGELKFAFREAKIAEIRSSRPIVSLYSERRTRLDAPIGRGRVGSVQPDFGIWARGRKPDRCKMIVEVKHYKRQARKNFQEALIDYANAHPLATVVLVNYGPVGSSFTDLPDGVRHRCLLIGHMHPLCDAAREKFQDVVSRCVGEPEKDIWRLELDCFPECVVIDTSISMSNILDSDWFRSFICGLEDWRVEELILIDSEVRDIVTVSELEEWLDKNKLGLSTDLAGPLSKLLDRNRRILVVTDSGGFAGLHAVSGTIAELEIGSEAGVKILELSRQR